MEYSLQTIPMDLQSFTRNFMWPKPVQLRAFTCHDFQYWQHNGATPSPRFLGMEDQLFKSQQIDPINGCGKHDTSMTAMSPMGMDPKWGPAMIWSYLERSSSRNAGFFLTCFAEHQIRGFVPCLLSFASMPPNFEEMTELRTTFNEILLWQSCARQELQTLHCMNRSWTGQTKPYHITWCESHCVPSTGYIDTVPVAFYTLPFSWHCRVPSVFPRLVGLILPGFAGKKNGTHHNVTNLTCLLLCWFVLGTSSTHFMPVQPSGIPTLCVYFPTLYNILQPHVTCATVGWNIYIYIFTYDNAHFFGGDGHPSIFNQIQKNEGFPC